MWCEQSCSERTVLFKTVAPGTQASKSAPSLQREAAPLRRDALHDLRQVVVHDTVQRRDLLLQRGVLLEEAPVSLDELLAALRGRAGGLVLYPLWPTADGGRPAKRVIVQAIKGGAAPLRLSPGLALHANGGYTAEADAILRDGAGLTL